MRIKLDLPDPLYHALLAQASVRGMTLQALLTERIEQGLSASQSPNIGGRSPLPVARRATGRPMSPHNNAELHQLLDAEDAQRQMRSKL